MTNFFTIALVPAPQDFAITLAGKQYQFRIRFRNSTAAPSWTLDIADANDTPLACGIALVPGAGLLEGLEYLGFSGELGVVTDTDQQDVPTFANLGVNNQLYFATP